MKEKKTGRKTPNKPEEKVPFDDLMEALLGVPRKNLIPPKPDKSKPKKRKPKEINHAENNTRS